MRIRPPLKARVPPDILRAVGLRLSEHGAEEAVPLRKRPYLRDQLVTHTGEDEVGESLPVGIRNPQRRVAGVHESLGAFDEPLEHPLDPRFGRDGEDGVAHSAQKRVLCGSSLRIVFRAHRLPIISP